jgi:hypothetical protein
MYLNLLRFLAWQNLALVPLLSASVVVALRDRGLPAALLAGILLWLFFIAIVTPFQGHGWGYRYLHPYLGSFALLAGYGYRELKGTIGRRIDGLVLSLSGVSVLVTIPMLIIAASRVIAPYLALDRLIAAQTTPIVLIDTYARPTVDGLWSGNAIENVRNLPDLRNRPLRFSSRAMSPELLVTLCRRGRVTLITSADQRRVGIGLNVPARSPPFEQLVASVEPKMPACFAQVSWPT